MTLEQEILATYNTNPIAVFSINEISKRIGKSYPYVNKTVHALIKQGILNRKETGRSHLCSINLANKQAVMLLALTELEKHETIPTNILEEAKKLDAQKQHHQALIYDPTTKQLLVITNNKPNNTTAKHLNTEQLTKQLLENKTFYEQKIVISGHEYFYNLITDPTITKRYHPLL